MGVQEAFHPEIFGGVYQQRDQSVETFESFEDGIEVLSLKKALKKYDWLEAKYLWRVIPAMKDEITRAVAENDKKVAFLPAFQM